MNYSVYLGTILLSDFILTSISINVYKYLGFRIILQVLGRTVGI